MKSKIVVVFCICFALSGCNTNHVRNSSERLIADNFRTAMEETDTEYDISSKEAENEERTLSKKSALDVPFHVEMDKNALQIGLVNQTTVTIFTEITDWTYSVKADYGKILNIKEKSFDYIKPKDEKQYEDTITVYFTDKENKRTYECVIPLNFPIPPEAVKNILSEVENENSVEP